MKTGAMLKLGLVLAAFATGACVVLALVYSATADVIKRRTQASLEATLKEIFPDADGFADITGSVRSQQGAVSFGSEYEIRRGGELLGAAVRASGPSYGGLITVLVGVGMDGRINGVKILDHSDTPGLGANAAYPEYFVNKDSHTTFYGQFSGKQVGDPFEVDNDVISVTAATVTSRAVAGIVKEAGTAILAWLAARGDILSAGAALSEGAAQ